jgi:thymidylate synthase
MKLGFPLLTTKKMAWKVMVTELLWFLRGDTNIKFLHDNGCHIWDGDYEKSGRTDGELGPIYGHQWRDWGSRYETNHILGTKTKRKPGIDQIQNLIQELQDNPDSRRLMVSAWNVEELDQMTLPPCHYGFQIYTRELSVKERVAEYEKLGYVKNIDPLDWAPKRAISLMWNQRSVDTPLGLPFNIASYALLLEMLARETNMVADELIGNLGDCHIYLDQQDGVREQLTRQPMALSKLVINDEFWNPDVSLFDQIEHIQPSDFYIENYESHPAIKFPLSN